MKLTLKRKSYDEDTYLRMAKFSLQHSDYDSDNLQNINQVDMMLHKRVDNLMDLDKSITEKHAIINVVTELVDGFNQIDLKKYYDSLLA